MGPAVRARITAAFFFPAGVTHINSEVAFEERESKVYSFNGHLLVFVDENSALATFRLFREVLQLCSRAEDRSG